MRELLIGLALLGASACYDAGAVDCTVSCTGPGECASGQVCGSDHLCAAPSVAGHCLAMGDDDDDNSMVAADAGVDAAPDGGNRVPLHLKIDGEGKVTVMGYGTCEKMAPQNGDCTFQVTLAQQLDLVAAPYGNRTFENWSGTNCALQDETCTFIPFGSNDIHAKFK